MICSCGHDEKQHTDDGFCFAHPGCSCVDYQASSDAKDVADD